MRKARNWKKSKSRVIVWLAVALVLEAALVLWPLSIIIPRMDSLRVVLIVVTAFGLIYAFSFDFFGDLASTLTFGLFFLLAFVLGLVLAPVLGRVFFVSLGRVLIPVLTLSQ